MKRNRRLTALMSGAAGYLLVLGAAGWAGAATVEPSAAPRVVADNAAGVRLAVEHLLALGHRRIAHLTGPAGNPLTRERARGFGEALAAHGLGARPEWKVAGDYGFGSGHRAARSLLAGGEPPTAVICDNDEMACGLVAEARVMGLAVPDDLSVIGFDDIELSAHVTPALTTVHQQRVEIGAAAARMMLALLDGEEPDRLTVVPVELVPRDSAAPPRG